MHQPDIDGERLAIAVVVIWAIELPKFNDGTLYGADSAVNRRHAHSQQLISFYFITDLQ